MTVRRHGVRGQPVRAHPVRKAAARGLWRVLRLGLAAALIVALAPVTIVGALTFATAWWRGWPPRRAYAAAAWCLPMVAAWFAAAALWPVPASTGLVSTGTASTGPVSTGPVSTGPAGWPAGLGPGALWTRVAALPGRSWLDMWQLAAHGHVLAAAIAVAAPAIPLGFLAGGRAWAIRMTRMATGSGGRSPASPATFDERLWRRQVRAARARTAAPGSVPLLALDGTVLTGAVIRSVRNRPLRPVSAGHDGGRSAALPYDRLRSHQVVIGSSGTGKTTLLLRLWAGFMAAGLRRYAAGGAARPLLVVLDCKGGASSRKVADRTRRVLRDAGAVGTAIWPDEAALSLWALPPEQLVTTLLDLVEHGTGGAAYYTDIMEAFVSLAVRAPGGPPVSAADFLHRLDPDWLAAAWAGREEAGEVTGRSAQRALQDVSLRFRALWRRLGPGLDGGATFADADAWYCILEGTAEASVAEAQARALTDLLASFAIASRREILFAVDEYSAVSRRLPIWRLYERARSLGLAIQVSAQSWEGLGDTEDERRRVAGTAEGGIWLLRVPRPEPVADLAGTRPVTDTSRRLTGPGTWESEGSSRTRLAPVVDGDLVRRLDVGQVAYVYRGEVTYVQVKRLTGRQAALAPATAAAGFPETGAAAARVPAQRAAAGTGQPQPDRLPDVSEVLDEAFGARHE